MPYGAPPLFRQGVSARARFLFFLMLSLATILVDGRLRALDDFRSAVVSFMSPLMTVISLPGEMIDDGSGYLISKRRLNEEVRRLSEENQLLQLEAARLEEMRQENENLRRLVSAVPRTSDRVVTAEVIGRVADSFSRRIQISAGANNGVEVGMPVIGPFGVLGQVSRTVNRLSEVTLLTDHTIRLSVTNTRTGQHFLLAGTGDGHLSVLFARPDADLQTGDELVTSGLDHLYPKEVLAAIVTTSEHQPGEPYRRVGAQPAANLSDVQFATVVLVNTKPTAELSQEDEASKNRFERRRRP